MTTSRNTARQRRAERAPLPKITSDEVRKLCPHYNAAIIAMKKLLKSLNGPLPKTRVGMEAELEFLTRITHDKDSLMVDCIRFQLNAERKLGALLATAMAVKTKAN